MRFLLLITLSFLTLSSAMAAEEKTPAQEEPAVADVVDTAHTAKDVDWVRVESTGMIGSGVQGGLEKTLWKGAKRSEIETLLKNVSDAPALRSILSLQRRLLLSKTDASLMDNDKPLSPGNDLLIQRINTLIKMGLYNDAWELYTQKAEEPYDVSIAQLGMLLLVMQNDLATACLEEKVFSARYPKDEFFNTLDRACSKTLGLSTTPKFENSTVLQAVYNDAQYSVSATSPTVLAKMTPLERALVLAEGKIRYDGLNADILKKTPSTLVSLYLMDRALPETAKTMIKAETDRRGLSRYIKSIGVGEAYKKAKTLSKDPEDQWPLIESALAEKSNPGDAIIFADMLLPLTPANLSTDTVEKVLSVLLIAGKELSPFWAQEAKKHVAEKPILYIYLKAFEALTPTANLNLSQEDTKKALDTLKPADSTQILAILDTLDKNGEDVNNPLKIYDKYSGLTLSGDYVMPTEELANMLDTATEQKQIGITVLVILNTLYDKPESLYSETIRKTLYSMLNVGLIEDARMVGSEIITSVLNRY